MNVLDITTYLSRKINGGLGTILFIGGLLFLLSYAVSNSENMSSGEVETVKGLLLFIKVTWPVCSLLALIPTYQDLFHLNKSKIKYKLLNEENVTAGIERIDEVAKKLEEKYLK